MTLPLATTNDEDAFADHIWARRHHLIYRAQLSVLYHLKRAAFFERSDKMVSAVTALAATAAVGAVLKVWPDLEKWAAVATAALSLVPLVWAPAQMATKHAELAGQFRRLLGRMEASGEYWEESQCNAFAGEFAELEAGEPAPLGALMAECQNQLALSVPETQRPKLIVLTWWQRRLKHFLDFDATVLAAQ